MSETSIKEVLEKLSIDSEYYDGIGRNYPSVSHINKILNEPAKYIAFINGEYSDPRTPAMEIGLATHTLVLEGEDKYKSEFDIAGPSRRHAEFKNYDGEKIVISESDAHLVRSIRQVLDDRQEWNDDIYYMMNTFDGEAEVPMLHEVDDLMWKMKVDKICDHMVYDLKTTSDLGRFAYSADTYNYDAQAWLYSEATGKEFRFVIVNKKTLEVAIGIPTDDFLARGKRKVYAATEAYKRYIIPALRDGDESYKHFTSEIYLD